MKISQRGIDLIKRFEGCELTAYKDSVSIYTIGYGHTLGVSPGETITQDEADSLLIADIERICEPCIEAHITADLTQNQYDALSSFIFNLGCGAFKGSTLRALVNSGNQLAACAQFRRWNKAGGKELQGLTNRRAVEAELFALPDDAA